MFGKTKQLEKRINELKDIVNRERINLAKQREEYETGLYNGLELGLSIMEGREPVFMVPDSKRNKEQEEERKGRTMYGNMRRTYKKED